MSATSNDNSHQKAKEVSWNFVREYYKYFNEKPEVLHLFYNKNSRLIRGLEGEEVNVCKGVQEIKKNIADMHLKDANVNITNIDSLDLFDDKVVVQVTGRFSNKDEAYRKFVQTIVLEPQPGGYYVSNDIFRYLKDEADEVVKQQQTDQGSTYIDDSVSSITEEKFNGDDSVSTLSTGTLADESTQEIGRDSKVVEETASDIPTKVGVPEVPALPKSETEDILNCVTEELADNESKSIESGPSEKATQVTVQTAKIPTNATQLTSPTQSPSKTQASWATLAASGSSKWDTSQLAEPSKGRVIHASITRTPSQTSNTRETPRDRNSNREFSLYVKVGNERMDHDALWSAFSNFGPVKNLDVVPAKSCAFVEFQSQDAYQRALQQRQISVPGFGNETVVVEERQERRKDDNTRYRNRQSYDNYQRNYGQAPHNTHNGMNSQRGGRGGDRRNVPRPPAKSPS